VGQSGVEMSISDLLDAEHVEHPVVGLGLHSLELVDGDLAVVNGDEVKQLAVLVDIDIELLDRRGVGIDIFSDGRFRLEEALERRLAHSHLFELSLLIALPRLALRLKCLLVLTALHGSHHGLDVEHLTAKCHVCILEGVAPLLDVILDLPRQLLGDRVR